MIRKELDDRWFEQYRRESLAGKRRMNGDQHRDWDRKLRALEGANARAVCTVIMSTHVRLRANPTHESAAGGVLINLDEVGILGFSRGELFDGNDIWLLDADSSFYFWGGAVKALPRHLPEYIPKPRTRSTESRFEASGEEIAPAWSEPILINRDSDILGEK